MKQTEFITSLAVDTPGCRQNIAEKVVGYMWGDKAPDCVPYTEDGESMFWVLDDHNDWFLQFTQDDPSRVRIWHRNPEKRHELIMGALALATLEITAIPVLTMEEPAFMGMSTDAGDALQKQWSGPRHLERRLMPCYVHGKLRSELGYDIARFAAGSIRDVDRQPCRVIDMSGATDGSNIHDAVIVSVELPHTEKPTRAAFIVSPDEEEIEAARKALQEAADRTTPEIPRVSV